jgi:hypothetical protein
MAGPSMEASKAQVRQLLKDLDSSFMRDRNALRARALEEEGNLARKYADEMKRRAAEYGVSVETGVTFTQGGNPQGWTRGRAPYFKLK